MRVSCLHQLVCYIRDPKDSVLRDSVYDPARLPSHPLHHHLQRHSRGGTNRTLRPRKCVLTTGDIVLRRQLRSVFSSLRTPSSFVFSFSISQSLACGSPLSATHPSWARRTGCASGTLQHLYPTFGRNQSGYSFFFRRGKRWTREARGGAWSIRSFSAQRRGRPEGIVDVSSRAVFVLVIFVLDSFRLPKLHFIMRWMIMMLMRINGCPVVFREDFFKKWRHNRINRHVKFPNYGDYLFESNEIPLLVSYLMRNLWCERRKE
jgi:hypothetical protein